MKEKRLTLLELNRLVRESIELTMPDEYWVEAELSECREARGGHCYMELVQRSADLGSNQSMGMGHGQTLFGNASRTLYNNRASYNNSAYNASANNTPVAKASAKCWASKWQVIRPYFERTTGQRLSAGMKVLMKVYPQFHETYGFSWIVTDIDPTFTLGDMARKRQEIIRQLKEEGVFDLQRELQLPLFCQRIAVISSATAAGYGDFCNQLADNPYGLQFQTQLFPATMQGEGVEQSIIDALNRVYSWNVECGMWNENTPAADSAFESNLIPHSTFHIPQERFDCVVIIRGGGAVSDMSGFDTLALAENVANFPIPIITGIGHDRDESILDMVSHQRVKTPTAAATFLISHLKAVLDAIDDAQTSIARCCSTQLSTMQAQLSTLSAAIPRLFSVVKTRQEARIDSLSNRLLAQMQQRIVGGRGRLETLEQRLPLIVERRLSAERHHLEMLDEKLRSLDPTLLLRRGYSITLKDGKALRDPSQLQPGDVIETRLEKGSLASTISSVQIKNSV